MCKKSSGSDEINERNEQKNRSKRAKIAKARNFEFSEKPNHARPNKDSARSLRNAFRPRAFGGRNLWEFSEISDR